MSDTQKIVVRVRPNHPTGTRRRAWFVFWTQPTRVEVNAEELKMIQEDQHLIIVTKWTWLEQATDQKKWITPPTDAKKDDDSETPPMTKKQIIERLTELQTQHPDLEISFKERESRDDLFNLMNHILATIEAWTEGTDENLADLSVEEIIARLEAKWLVEWTDFVKDAEKADLIELLLA